MLKASYPPEWPRVWPHEDYWNYYTLNDGLAGTVSETFLVAYNVYKESRYEDALRRLGGFLILAQMPDPQPAWAQQYNYAMHPVWARKFEPPAISGLESEDAVRATLTGWSARLRQETGEGFPEKVTAFREGMAVHGRYGQPCPVCGAPVQRVVYADNEANYCATCQTGGRLLADRSLSRLLRDDWPRTLEELERRRAPKP